MSNHRAPEALPDVRPIDGFPLSDADCRALVRGEWVRWPGNIEQFLELPGRYEMIDGWIMPKRRG